MAKHTALIEVWDYAMPPRKDGKPRVARSPRYWLYTPLQDCERCGRRSTPKNVQYRSGLSLTLCMGCWNMLRPISRAIEEVEVLRKLCRKIEREAKAHG